MLDFALLGTGGMMPMPNRYLASLLIRISGRLLLVDCGEGTQVSLKMLGWGFKAIDAIFFTHYHADHISGLPGMLLTIGNAGRTEPLVLCGPKGLVEVVNGLRKIAPELPFPITYYVLEEMRGEPLHFAGADVRFLPVDHMVKCVAYRFDLKRQGRFDESKARENAVPKAVWSKLQKEGSAVYHEKLYTADMVLGKERKGISLAYCTDTRPTADIPSFIHQSDLFICEGMYGSDEKRDKAVTNRHMLFSEAASLAKEGQVRRLLLTHYSPSISDPNEFLQNATKIFPDTELGYDRMTDTLAFSEEVSGCTD